MGSEHEDFVEPVEGKLRAIWGEVQADDRGGTGVDRRLFVGKAWAGIDDVLDGPSGDPFSDDLDFAGLQRSKVLGHLGLAIDRSDFAQQIARFGVPRNDGRIARLTTFEQAFEIGHSKATLGFRGLMACIAIGAENRQDIFGPRDRDRVGSLGLKCQKA